MSMGPAEDITCAQLVEIVTEYLEGGLTFPERVVVASHLLDCEGCVNYIDQMRATIRLTGRLREDELPSEVEAALIRAFRGFQNSPG
jgi:predicted anti-sigma-YlaC factor YlaD